jgi:pentapeptide MXKDX repeat protein
MNRLILTLAAALVGTSLALSPAAFAQGMSKSDTPMSKSGDTMGKGTMSKTGDTMGKTTGEKGTMKKDEMGKKTDEMSGGMKK